MRNLCPIIKREKRMKLPAAHAAQAPALRELQGILAKANKEDELFGIWKDHKDIQNVDEYVRNLRKGRP